MLVSLRRASLGPAAGVIVYGPLPFGSLRAAKSDRLLDLPAPLDRRFVHPAYTSEIFSGTLGSCGNV
jgi:hypothetical protein